MSELRPQVLYRMFNRAGDLLYVGITADIGMRFAQHSATQPWWKSVGRIAVEHHDDRPSVERAERAAIRAEAPLYNRVHRPRETEWQPAASEPGEVAPHRNVRVDDGRWAMFAAAVGARNRSRRIREFIGSVVAAPETWLALRAIGAAQAEPMSVGINRALRAYVARNRHVLVEQQKQA